MNPPQKPPRTRPRTRHESHPRVLAFSGSLSRNSINSRFVQIAMAGATDAGADVTYVHLADFDVPLYSAEREADTGMPHNARSFKALMTEHDGFLISVPEYNGSVTGAFKNMIDWVSRPSDGNPGKAAFTGKYAGLLSASPGRFGGVRALDHAWYILSHLGVTIVPQNFPLGGAKAIIGDDGGIADTGIRDSAHAIGRALADAVCPVPL